MVSWRVCSESASTNAAARTARGTAAVRKATKTGVVRLRIAQEREIVDRDHPFGV